MDRVPAPVAEKVLSAALPGDVLMERLNGAGEARARPHPGWPLLWVRGQDDSQIIWDDELVTTHWPSAVIVSVPGGHRPYASHPAEFAEVLREFWDSAHVL